MGAEKTPFVVVDHDGESFEGKTLSEAQEKQLFYRKQRDAQSQARDEHNLMIFQSLVKAATPILAAIGTGLLEVDARERASLAEERAHELALVQANPEYATLKLTQQHELNKQGFASIIKTLDEVVTAGIGLVQAAARK